MDDAPFPGWVSWKDNLSMRHPEIQIHDSGLVARHDQACYVCGNSKAIYRIDLGVFLPCDTCARKGWKLEQPPKWVPAWLKRLIGDRRLRNGA